MLPPWAATISWTIASPRPVPATTLCPGMRKNFSKTQQVFRRYAGAGVGHGESDAVARGRGPEANLAASRRVRQGVVEEVAQGVIHAGNIPSDRGQVVGSLHDHFNSLVVGPGANGGGGGDKELRAVRHESQGCRGPAPAEPGRAGCSPFQKARRRFAPLSGNPVCLGVNGPTASSSSKCRARRRPSGASARGSRWLPVAFHLVEQAEARNVLEDGAVHQRLSVWIANGQEARQVTVLLPAIARAMARSN